MRRHLAAIFLVAAAAAAAAIPLACGPDMGNTTPPVCGNGKPESGEQCDLGENNGKEGYPCSSGCRTVTLTRSTLNVTWGILGKTDVMGFDGSTCSKIEADQALVHIDGPDGIQFDQTVDCASYTTRILGVCTPPAGGGSQDCSRQLPLGVYQAKIRLVRASDKKDMTTSVLSPPVNNAQHGDTLELPVDFALSALLNRSTLRGSLLLDLSWGEAKKNCETATPLVNAESLWLERPGSGTPDSGMTKSKVLLDGTPGHCFVPDKAPNQGRFAEEAPELQLGRYTLRIKGYAGANVLTYCTTVDVYVGPSANNQPFQIVVPPVVPTDAGLARCDEK